VNAGPDGARPGIGAGSPGQDTPGQDTTEVARQLRDTIAAQFGRSLHIRTLDTGSCAGSSSPPRPGTRTCCW
jgi:hypothetical protein